VIAETVDSTVVAATDAAHTVADATIVAETATVDFVHSVSDRA
jgi:hypothetical protein